MIYVIWPNSIDRYLTVCIDSESDIDLHLVSDLDKVNQSGVH